MDIKNEATAVEFVNAWKADCTSPRRRARTFRDAAGSQKTIANSYAFSGHVARMREHFDAAKVLAKAEHEQLLEALRAEGVEAHPNEIPFAARSSAELWGVLNERDLERLLAKGVTS